MSNKRSNQSKKRNVVVENVQPTEDAVLNTAPMQQSLKDLIFVQIASYRDPQLIPTIDSLLQNADNPDQFTFGICWQYGPDEDPNVFDDKPNFRVYKAHYTESRGLGWARNLTNQLYKGEKYTLQIDSHHRFLPHWDTMMMEDFAQAKEMADKPVLSTYVPPFSPGDALPAAIPSLMSQYEFSADKLLMSMPYYIPNYQNVTRVVRARTISAHFFFAEGRFIEEVPYDPDAFFGGYVEEATLSARAFTHGFDFFSPYRCYLFHEYTRQGRPKIWEDKPQDTGKWDIHARNKTRQLMGQEEHGIELGVYGLGTVRSLHDWEVYAGFDFKNCRLQQYTLEVREPPNPLPWDDGFKKKSFTYTVRWSPEKIQSDVAAKAGSTQLKCITLGFETNASLTLHRADMIPEKYPEVFSFTQNSVTVTFESCDKPHKWVMWPLFEDGSWGTSQQGQV